MYSSHHERLKRAALPRKRKIIALRKKGKTWREIGDLLGITRQRAQVLGATAAL